MLQVRYDFMMMMMMVVVVVVVMVMMMEKEEHPDPRLRDHRLRPPRLQRRRRCHR